MANGMKTHTVISSLVPTLPLSSFAPAKTSSTFPTTAAGTLAAHFARAVDQTSVSSWNSAIADLARGGDAYSALRAFSSLRRLRLTPDRSSFPPALTAAADLAAHFAGRQLHLLSLRLGLHLDLFVASSLVHMYAKCHLPDDARKAFDESPNPNAVLWTAMISGYVSNNASRSAISLFREFLAVAGPLEVDSAAAVSVLSACARLTEKMAVVGFHGLVLKIGLPEVGVWNTLVDAYAKCGLLDLARKVFDEMLHRDVVSWNSMIAVYAQNGLSAEALNLYSDLARSGGMRHNAVTLSAVLLACSHAGALQIGRCIHDRVRRLFYLCYFLGMLLAQCAIVKDTRK